MRYEVLSYENIRSLRVDGGYTHLDRTLTAR